LPVPYPVYVGLFFSEIKELIGNDTFLKFSDFRTNASYRFCERYNGGAFSGAYLHAGMVRVLVKIKLESM